MSEKILVPLDGSGLGESALEYVNNFISRVAPTEQVTVILLHIITTLTHQLDVHSGGVGTVIIPFAPEEIVKMEKESGEYLEKASKKITGCGAEVEIHIVIGNDPAEEIIKAEVDFGCDLVAMSTHGRSGLSRWAFGSVTDKVLRGGKVPVLMVRAKKH